jgi:hypothetical protein
MLNKEKTILESLMTCPTSSPSKTLSLCQAIALLIIPWLTGCSGSLPSQSSTLTPYSSTPTRSAVPLDLLEETAPTGTLAPLETNMVEASPCPPVGEPEPLVYIPFDALPESLLDFMNSGGSINDMGEALYEAGVANLPEPIATGDMDGDGLDEVVVSIFDPDSVSLPPAGILLIYSCQDSVYRLVYKEDTRSADGAPGIRFLQDLNADGRDDLVVSSASCGAHTCFERVQVIQWDGTSYRNHLEGDSSDLPYPNIYLSPGVPEGVYEIQVTGSGIGSVGAGPQRNVTRVWSFSEDAQLWEVSDFQQEPSNYRIHVLHDAVDAARNGDYQQALVLYNRVINDTTLEDWTDPELEQLWIKAFARYQMAVIYTILDRGTFANTILSELESTTSPDNPQYAYYEMAVMYMDGYQEGGIERGCMFAQDYAALHPGLLEPFGPLAFGYGNPIFTDQDICP